MVAVTEIDVLFAGVQVANLTSAVDGTPDCLDDHQTSW
jgi:hypothetical protein